MREKNVKRAAHGLFMSQADDKNKLLSDFTHNKDARELIQDQGRALVILEKLILPHGKDSYSEDYMSSLLLKKLKKKGHRIQGDEDEDSPTYAAEKEKWEKSRLERVPTLLGKSLVDEVAKEKAKEEAAKPFLAPEVSVPVAQPTKAKIPVTDIRFYIDIIRFYIRGSKK